MVEPQNQMLLAVMQSVVAIIAQVELIMTAAQILTQMGPQVRGVSSSLVILLISYPVWVVRVVTAAVVGVTVEGVAEGVMALAAEATPVLSTGEYKWQQKAL
jgi:hypothetical protein